MSEKKIYVGNGKKNPKYDLINFSICIDDLPEQYINGGKNGKKYIKLTMSQNYKGEVDKFGNTHNVTVNTWKPDTVQQSTQSHGVEGFNIPDIPPPAEDPSGLPF